MLGDVCKHMIKIPSALIEEIMEWKLDNNCLWKEYIGENGMCLRINKKSDKLKKIVRVVNIKLKHIFVMNELRVSIRSR